MVRGHVPGAAAGLPPLGRLPATNRLQLSIGLALHNREALTNFLRQLYDPASGVYHQYLTPEQFTQAFGPTEAEYQAVIAFAKAHGLAVTGAHANRMLVGVAGTAADVERAFQVKLNQYQHPREARAFFAPDSEPSVDKGLRVLHISGLNSCTLPRPLIHSRPVLPARGAAPLAGSGPGGLYFGSDYRKAYLSGLALTGTGQTVGLLELDGYFKSDITAYETKAGLAQVPLVIVPVDGYNGVPLSPSADTNYLGVEVAVDIELTVSMAPGLSQIRVYEASPELYVPPVDDLLNAMATENLAKQLACCWTFDIDSTSQQILQEFAAQGQSFFIGAGDTGSWGSYVDQPLDNPFLTVVGGTVLTTSASHAYQSETTWPGTGGGVSSIYALPDWQQGISMSLDGGSTIMRDIPDVALVATNAWGEFEDGQSGLVYGTSIATPLWAAFTALVNEQGATEGKPPVGFLNPALYAVGKGSSYSACFHDITTGDNTSTNNPDGYFAVRGYDLCTGWGTINGGSSLIAALLAQPTEPLRITPPLGFTSQGPVGGPFSATTQTYTLTNAGTTSLNWSLVNTSAWLQVSPVDGTLVPGGPAATVTVSLEPSVTNLLIVSYAGTAFSPGGTISFTNLNDGVGQNRQFSLLVGNGGFETGDFTDWNFSADTNNIVDSVDATDVFAGIPFIAGVNDSLFIHSGIYGLCLGQYGKLGSLSQTLPTTPGAQYLLSFWLDCPTNSPGDGVVEFLAMWNGAQVFQEPNTTGVFTWTNVQLVVSATETSTALEFAFRNDPGAWGLDDISVTALPTPTIQAVTQAGGLISFTWTTVPGLAYQVQYTDSLASPNWSNLFKSNLTATGPTLSASDSLTSAPQRFYRIVLE